MLQALLYFNPTAGPQPISPARLRKVTELLFSHGIHCQAVVSKPRLAGPPVLDLTDKKLLVVMGGDGTIHEVLQLAARTGIPLGVLPSGTANVLAAELGIPRQLERAVKVLRTGIHRPMALGKAEGEYFHLMAGIGLDGSVIRRTSARLKRNLGKAAYWLNGLRTILDAKPELFQLEVAGTTYPATFAVISNTRFYGGRFQITPAASPFSDQFSVCIFSGQRRIDFIRYTLGILSGRHTSFSDVILLSAPTIDLRAAPGVLVQLDGDLAPDRPSHFEIEAGAMQVVVPDK